MSIPDANTLLRTVKKLFHLKRRRTVIENNELDSALVMLKEQHGMSFVLVGQKINASAGVLARRARHFKASHGEVEIEVGSSETALTHGSSIHEAPMELILAEEDELARKMARFCFITGKLLRDWFRKEAIESDYDPEEFVERLGEMRREHMDLTKEVENLRSLLEKSEANHRKLKGHSNKSRSNSTNRRSR